MFYNILGTWRKLKIYAQYQKGNQPKLTQCKHWKIYPMQANGYSVFYAILICMLIYTSFFKSMITYLFWSQLTSSPGLSFWSQLTWSQLTWSQFNGLSWPGLSWLGLSWHGLSWPGLNWPTTLIVTCVGIIYILGKILIQYMNAKHIGKDTKMHNNHDMSTLKSGICQKGFRKRK